MSWAPSFVPNAGIEPAPFVAIDTIAASSNLPDFSRASLLSFLLGATTFPPPAWQEAQFAPKTDAPLSKSVAKAEGARPPTAAANRPRAKPRINGFQPSDLRFFSTATC